MSVKMENFGNCYNLEKKGTKLAKMTIIFWLKPLNT